MEAVTACVCTLEKNRKDCDNDALQPYTLTEVERCLLGLEMGLPERSPAAVARPRSATTEARQIVATNLENLAVAVRAEGGDVAPKSARQLRRSDKAVCRRPEKFLSAPGRVQLMESSPAQDGQDAHRTVCVQLTNRFDRRNMRARSLGPIAASRYHTAPTLLPIDEAPPEDSVSSKGCVDLEHLPRIGRTYLKSFKPGDLDEDREEFDKVWTMANAPLVEAPAKSKCSMPSEDSAHPCDIHAVKYPSLVDGMTSRTVGSRQGSKTRRKSDQEDSFIMPTLLDSHGPTNMEGCSMWDFDPKLPVKYQSESSSAFEPTKEASGLSGAMRKVRGSLHNMSTSFWGPRKVRTVKDIMGETCDQIIEQGFAGCRST